MCDAQRVHVRNASDELCARHARRVSALAQRRDRRDLRHDVLRARRHAAGRRARARAPHRTHLSVDFAERAGVGRAGVRASCREPRARTRATSDAPTLDNCVKQLAALHLNATPLAAASPGGGGRRVAPAP